VADARKVVETAKRYAVGAVAALSQPATFVGDMRLAAEWLEDAARMLRGQVAASGVGTEAVVVPGVMGATEDAT